MGSMGSTCSTQNEAPLPMEESWRGVGSIRTPTVTFECYLPSSLSHEELPGNFIFMCFCVLPACMYMYHVHTFPMEAKEGVRSPGTGIVDHWELL